MGKTRNARLDKLDAIIQRLEQEVRSMREFESEKMERDERNKDIILELEKNLGGYYNDEGRWTQF